VCYPLSQKRDKIERESEREKREEEISGIGALVAVGIQIAFRISALNANCSAL
jgi:hypothetical protein